TMQTKNAVVYAGVDVAKATLQLHLQGRQSEICNTSKALRQLRTQLQKLSGAHTVCEATASYERALDRVLHQEQIRACVTNAAPLGHPRPIGRADPMAQTIHSRPGLGQNPSRAS